MSEENLELIKAIAQGDFKAIPEVVLTKWIDSKRFEKIFIDAGACQTAHCGRRKPHFDFGGNTSPIVPYRHLPQTLRGLTADCRSLV